MNGLVMSVRDMAITRDVSLRAWNWHALRPISSDDETVCCVPTMQPCLCGQDYWGGRSTWVEQMHRMACSPLRSRPAGASAMSTRRGLRMQGTPDYCDLRADVTSVREWTPYCSVAVR